MSLLNKQLCVEQLNCVFIPVPKLESLPTKRQNGLAAVLCHVTATSRHIVATDRNVIIIASVLALWVRDCNEYKI